MTKITYTFEQWCKENNQTDFLFLWDVKLNNCKPCEVAYKSNKKFYFKCKKNLHKPRQIMLSNLTKSTSKTISDNLCTGCNSIGQYIINNFSKEVFEKIWSDKNTKDAFDILKNSHYKIWLRCMNNSMHPDYECIASNATKTLGCPYCSGKKVCTTNSLGYLCPEVLEIWSDKNDKSPFDYTCSSSKEVWWKCKNGLHKDYKRRIDNSKLYGFKCHECVKEMLFLKKEDLTGEIFNKLKVIEPDIDRTTKTRSSYWFCDCECGTKHKSILAAHLKSGATQSCGCLWLNNITGKNHYNWKGGLSSEREKLRSSNEHVQWSKNIYKRCYYTCQCCGQFNRIKKNAHHFYNFSNNENIRFDVNNGILLCEECHSHIHKGSFHNIYGIINNTPEQLEEYINSKRQLLGINISFTIDSYLNGEILKPINNINSNKMTS